MEPGAEADEQAESARIVDRLRRNDEWALWDVQRLFGPQVLRRLHHKFFQVAGEADLEEAFSDGLFDLWNNRRGYDPSRLGLANWLYLLTRNRLIDLLRKRRGRVRSLPGNELATYPAKSASLPEAEQHDRKARLKAHVREWVRALPHRDQEILFAWSVVGGNETWTPPVAERLGMDSKSVRVRLHRLLDKLREELRAHNEILERG